MGSMSIWHWLIVLAVVVLVFGTKKLRNMGGDLGAAIKNFKGAMKEGEEQGAKDADKIAAEQRPGESTPSGESREKTHV